MLYKTKSYVHPHCEISLNLTPLRATIYKCMAEFSDPSVQEEVTHPLPPPPPWGWPAACMVSKHLPGRLQAKDGPRQTSHYTSRPAVKNPHIIKTGLHHTHSCGGGGGGYTVLRDLATGNRPHTILVMAFLNSKVWSRTKAIFGEKKCSMKSFLLCTIIAKECSGCAMCTETKTSIFPQIIDGAETLIVHTVHRQQI